MESSAETAIGTEGDDTKGIESNSKTSSLKYGFETLISSTTNRPVSEGKPGAKSCLLWCEVCKTRLTHPMSAISHFAGSSHFAKVDPHKMYTKHKILNNSGPATKFSRQEIPGTGVARGDKNNINKTGPAIADLSTWIDRSSQGGGHTRGKDIFSSDITRSGPAVNAGGSMVPSPNNRGFNLSRNLRDDFSTDDNNDNSGGLAGTSSCRLSQHNSFSASKSHHELLNERFPGNKQTVSSSDIINEEIWSHDISEDKRQEDQSFRSQQSDMSRTVDHGVNSPYHWKGLAKGNNNSDLSFTSQNNYHLEESLHNRSPQYQQVDGKNIHYKDGNWDNEFQSYYEAGSSHADHGYEDPYRDKRKDNRDYQSGSSFTSQNKFGCIGDHLAKRRQQDQQNNDERGCSKTGLSYNNTRTYDPSSIISQRDHPSMHKQGYQWNPS